MIAITTNSLNQCKKPLFVSSCLLLQLVIVASIRASEPRRANSIQLWMTLFPIRTLALRSN